MAITPDARRGSADASTEAVAHGGTLADVLDVILDKGLVIDAFVRVSLVGIEILTVDARIVVASMDTYMHFAREAHRLEMGGGQGSIKQGLGGVMGGLAEGGAHSITRGALQGAGEGLREGLLPPRKAPEDRRGVVQRAVGAIQDALSPDSKQEDRERPSAEESDRSAPAASAEPRRTPRRQAPGGPARQGEKGTRGGGAARRSAPASRRAPTRDPEG